MTSRKRLLIFGLFLSPLVVFLFSLTLGPSDISLPALGRTLLSPLVKAWQGSVSPVEQDIVLGIRLPRLLLGLAVGAALSVSGASLQAVFKNPLVNEYILGISSGAAFGASLSIVILGQAFPPQIAAFAFALTAVALVLLVSRGPRFSPVSVLLTGVIISAFFSALLSFVEFFASPYSLQALFYWLMGNLGGAGWRDLAVPLAVMAAGTTVLLLMSWRLNVLSLSDEDARALGLNVRRNQGAVVLTATLVTAAAVSVSGIIGWMGLIIPHLVRMIVGVDNRKVLPLSAALGASLLVLADDAARGLAAFEVPVGIFTSLIGLPLFILLLSKSSKIWR
jgi:iron complex transport system permease protein